MNYAYRPDIDGLRAIAVLAVLIYHAFPNVLPSGFIGVDIFFVISGYLISSILLRQLQNNNFSIAHFYAQRIKRIFPALALILIFCLCVGWIALTAGEYKQLGRYTAGGAAFLNNFLFWRDAGYFDNAAATKPLLHLWSLAIEEQFYLIWPILLWLCHKLSKKNGLKAALISSAFIASLWFSYRLVQSDGTADFYSPLSRAWELALGALVAYIHLLKNKKTQILAFYATHCLSLMGLIFLVSGFVLINHHRAFPGLWALLPALGAACWIFVGESALLNKLILSNRVLVWIGLISYPLYLWHWPLLSFARIFEGQTPTVSVRMALLLISVLLAWLTYRFIERPIRFSQTTQTSSKVVISTLGIIMVSLLLTGYALKRNEGMPERHSDRLKADASTMVLGADRDLLKRECGLPTEQASKFEWCLSQNKSSPPRFAVLGDSKGEALYYGLAREAKTNENWLMMGSFHTFQLRGDIAGIQLQQAIYRLIRDPEIKTVVLVSAIRNLFLINPLSGLIDKNYSTSDIEKMVDDQTQVIRQLTQAGKQVVLVADNPTLPDPRDCVEGEMSNLPVLNRLLYRTANPHCSIRYTDHLRETQAYQNFLKKVATKNPTLLIFDVRPLLCNEAANECTYFENKQFLYSYGDHISDYANSKIAKQLLPLTRPQ